MKQLFTILLILLCYFNGFSQCSDNTTATTTPTTIGIIIYSNDIETVWNAVRFANFSKNKGDEVSVFLLGKGVELENLIHTEKDLKEQAESFLDSGGTILGCGTCLQSRNNNSPKVCMFSSMADLYELVRKNKIVMTF